MFKKGDRVKPSIIALNYGLWKTKQKRQGTVATQSNSNASGVAVIWDGNKSYEYVHRSFVEKVDA